MQAVEFRHESTARLEHGLRRRAQAATVINYCQGVYRVVTKQGEPVECLEFDLRFKTDSSENGPKPGTAVLINAGMRGDRGFVIFSNPEVLTTYLKTSC